VDEATPEADAPRPAEARAGGGAGEVFLAFLFQGLTAFGGPLVHIGCFRREFVERRRWIGEAAFAELTALCQFLPGPASSQLGMALGLRRAGVSGMLAAWIGFTLPAAAVMIGLAYAAPRLTGAFGEGWLHGLKIAAAAVVAQALVAMARTLAVGPIRAGIAIGAAAGVSLAPGAASQILALAAGAIFGLALLAEPGEARNEPGVPVSPRAAVWAFAAFAILLGVLPVAAQLLENPTLGVASVFYRTGALVFGGGHVVLPLLEAEVVERGWIDTDSFLAGYGFVQALPGPLFSFAGFVGAAQQVAPGGWWGGLVAIVAIFLPSLLLVPAALPFWGAIKANAGARGALAGANAVVVGLLAAALWDPVLGGAVQRLTDWALVAAAYVFLAVARLPPWLVVAGFAVATGLMTR